MTATTKEPLPRSRQATGLTAWKRDVRTRLAELNELPRCREEAMEARRRRESLQRTLELVDRLGQPRSRRTPGPTAVIVHRSAWVRENLACLLAESGVTVVGAADDGAYGLAYIVVAQPELVVLEDHLPWTTSIELVHTARLFSPRTHFVVQADDLALGIACVEAGADAAVSRRTRLAELCEQCVSLLDAA